ncbi:MAG: HAD family hydrolase [Syntrophomonadaceae bacterium]|nr:HAD family hydrolase [Syntrophomonadaceae bacterium]
MKLAVFDFDGTLLMKDTLPCLGREWVRQKRSKSRYLLAYFSVMPAVLLYKAGFISREKMKNFAFDRFNRIFNKMTRLAIRSFFQEAYPNLKKLFNSKVMDEIKKAREQGFYCVLLSGSYSDLMNIVAGDLGMHRVIAADLAFRDGKFDCKGDTPFIGGESKITLLQKAFAGEDVDWAASRCFADSYTDILVMELVGEAVAVNPDPGLLAHARHRNWRVLSEA